MKEFVLDIHTHSLASGHAYGTIREMAAAAAEAGLQVLGLAEHGPAIPGAVHPFYFTNLGVIPKSLYGVQIMHGCEADVLAGGKWIWKSGICGIWTISLLASIASAMKMKARREIRTMWSPV